MMRTILAAIAVIGATMSSSADIISPGEKPIVRCASIANSNSFPDIVIIGASIFGSTITRYVIKQDSCMTKGYKFSHFYVLWTTKAYFDSVGLDSLPLASVVGLTKSKVSSGAAPLYILSSTIEPYGGTVPTSNPLASEELHYSLVNTNGILSIYLSQKVSISTTGSRTVENFSNTIKQRNIDRRGGSLFHGSLGSRGYCAFSTDFSGPLQAAIINCAGRTARKEAFSCKPGATYVFAFGNLPCGIYWVRMQTPNGVFSSMVNQIN